MAKDLGVEMNILLHGFLGMVFYALQAHEIDLIDKSSKCRMQHMPFFLDGIMHI